MSQKLHLQTPNLEVPFQKREERERNERVISLYKTGSYSYTSLARIFKITKQRIYQIIKKDKDIIKNEELVQEVDPRNTPDQW